MSTPKAGSNSPSLLAWKASSVHRGARLLYIMRLSSVLGWFGFQGHRAGVRYRYRAAVEPLAPSSLRSCYARDVAARLIGLPPVRLKRVVTAMNTMGTVVLAPFAANAEVVLPGTAITFTGVDRSAINPDIRSF